MTTTPLAAMGALVTALLVWSPPLHAPPWTLTRTGKGPGPSGW